MAERLDHHRRHGLINIQSEPIEVPKISRDQRQIVLQSVAAIRLSTADTGRFAGSQEASPAIRDRLIDGQHSPVRNLGNSARASQ